MPRSAAGDRIVEGFAVAFPDGLELRLRSFSRGMTLIWIRCRPSGRMTQPSADRLLTFTFETPKPVQKTRPFRGSSRVVGKREVEGRRSPGSWLRVIEGLSATRSGYT